MSLEIEPMLLIPFVENAFKHGIGGMEEPFIQITLAIVEGTLYFKVRNIYDVQGGSKDENSGIGLANTQSRLRLLYAGKYKLNVSKDDSFYNLDLMLQLK